MEILKILIVDDETAMGNAVARSLKNYTVHVAEVELDVGYAIEHVDTGEKALEIIHSRPPDILLLDHKLPGVSGMEILSLLSEKHHDLLTVMITAYASLENAIAATHRGAYDFLAKPFTPDELKSIVYRTTKHLLLCRQAEKLAGEKRRIRFEFISVLAHELKAPLAAVTQYLEVMRDADPTGDADLIRQGIDRSLGRIMGMRKLIADLLDVTRLESGQRPRQMVTIDLVSLTRKVLETMNVEAVKRDIVMQVHADAPVRIIADLWEVETIVSNLVSNAVKYNRTSGRVDIYFMPRENDIAIRVEDTGIGISEEDAALLFREFARIRNNETDYISGSGLGLSIVKKIAAHYDGDIFLDSAPGRGSVFEVVLKACSDGSSVTSSNMNPVKSRDQKAL